SKIAEPLDTGAINPSTCVMNESYRAIRFVGKSGYSFYRRKWARQLLRAQDAGCYWLLSLPLFLQRAPSVTLVSKPAEAVIFRLKQPLTESWEKKSCVLCWPLLPVMLKLASNSNVSLGVTVLETTLNESRPWPCCAATLRNCCRTVVVCDPPEPSAFTWKVKSRFRGHSKRCDADPPSRPLVLVSEDIEVRCLMFWSKSVLVMLKSCRLEKLMFCRTLVSTRPCEVRTKPSTRKLRVEVTVTEPVIVPSAAVVRFSTTFGLGHPMVLRVTSPVTCCDPWSWNTSSVAVVEKPLLAPKTFTETWCGCPLLRRPAKGVRSTR